MTTSPYDNLPVSPRQSTSGVPKDQLQYVDVNLESAEELPADPISGRTGETAAQAATQSAGRANATTATAGQTTAAESSSARTAKAGSMQTHNQSSAPMKSDSTPRSRNQDSASMHPEGPVQAEKPNESSGQQASPAQSGKPNDLFGQQAKQASPADAANPTGSSGSINSADPTDSTSLESSAGSANSAGSVDSTDPASSANQASSTRSAGSVSPAKRTSTESAHQTTNQMQQDRQAFAPPHPGEAETASARSSERPRPGETETASAKQPERPQPNKTALTPVQTAKQPQSPDLVPAAVPAQPAGPIQPGFAKTTPFEKAPKYDKQSIQNIWGQQEYILPFEESLLVPDTMPDMEEILFAEGRVDLAQPAKSSYEKNDSVSGDITLYTVYRPEPAADSPVDVVKSAIAFKTDKCWNKAEGDDFRVAVTIKSISTEKINERKFIARGQLLITFTEIAKKELMVFSGTDDPCLVQSDGHICVTGLDFETDETTEISQEINCREEQPSPIKILKESTRIVENHRQITSGKLVINASIHSQILYLGEKDGEQKLSCTMNKTDFTQFVMVDDNADPDRMKITFRGGSLKVKIENQDKFLLHGQVTTLIQGYKNQEIPIVADAYHKNSEIKFDINAQQLSAIKDTVTGEISAREVISPKENEKKPETLLCGNCHIASLEGRLEHGRVVIEGTMPVKILALDEENTPFLIENTIPLRGSLEMPSETNDVTLCISSALKEFWFDEINSRQMEVNASISLNIWSLGKETFKTLENLCFAETKEPGRRISMALYVVGTGDTLWDVAKKYKSDMNLLAELNQIDPQKPLSEGMKLLVAK